MRGRKPAEISTELEALCGELEAWRSSQTGRARIPQTIWTSAVAMARKHGPYQVARTLRLDYARLKMLAEVKDAGEKAPAFVELSGLAAGPACIVEYETRRGTLRIQFRSAVPDLTQLSQTLLGVRT